MEEQFGIDKLKEVGLVLTQFGMKLESALSEDSPKGKKLAFSEVIDLGIFVAPKAIGLAGDAEQIRNEFNDLSNDELEELKAFIAEKLDLENDKVEALIEAALDWADSTNDLRLAVKDILDK